jgi:hypothetical protein
MAVRKKSKKPDSDARRKKHWLKEPGFLNLIIINLVNALSIASGVY